MAPPTDRRPARAGGAVPTLIAGAVAAAVARRALRAALEVRLRRVVRALNEGDHRPLLAMYADDAVLRFPEGDHRWAGEHRGRAAVDRFLRDFTAAALQGEVREVTVAGPLWRMTAVVRLDDRAHGPDGRELYRNRAVLLIRTRGGRIVEHEDFFEDTRRMATLEERLVALGITPVA